MFPGQKLTLGQFAPPDFTITIKIGDETFTEKGKLFSEATFISATETGKKSRVCVCERS
jgi:hypothetical protein